MSGRGVRLIHRSISVLVTTVMVAACLLAVLMIVPTLLGFQRYVIVSGSMEPTIPVGSVVYDEVVPLEEIEVGDVITFLPPPEFDIHDPVTHRVVDISKVGGKDGTPLQLVFRTKGDNNDDVDPWQMVLDGPDQARMVHHIPYVGYFYMALQVRWVQVLVIGVPALLLIAYIVITLWRASGDAVRAEHAAAYDDQAEEQDEVPS